MNENTRILVTIDGDTCIAEIHTRATNISDIFDQYEVLEIINMETGEQLYREQDVPDDPMPYISETLMDFFNEIDFN